MRIIFFLLIFQLIAPAFLPITQPFSGEHKKSASIQVQHSAILLPLLLKEKEENEHEEHQVTLFLTQLIIDFTDHSTALTAFHQSRFNSVPAGVIHDHFPPIFFLNCNYRI